MLRLLFADFPTFSGREEALEKCIDPSTRARIRSRLAQDDKSYALLCGRMIEVA
jgi:hypothetical protein